MAIVNGGHVIFSGSGVVLNSETVGSVVRRRCCCTSVDCKLFKGNLESCL